MLKDHDGYIDYHNYESNEVHISYYSNHQILMGHGRYKECKEQRKGFVGVSSSQGIVDVAH